MSGSSGPSAPPSGVVQNSALSFVASAQPTMQTSTENPSLHQQEPVEPEMSQVDRLVPAGLKALYDACSTVYPDQPNPLQVTTRLKYWLGGQDPLDYISMYWNPGKPEEHVPPHWHYVSFGLSDLHGDGRVHPPADRVVMSAGGRAPSGFGLELTLRLATDPGDQPPLWPAALLQALARYVFTTGNKFCAGDHISWHRVLDGSAESRVRHLLVAADPQLATVNTAHGTVCFLQMVGCTGRELKASQRGSGFEVLKLIGEDPHCGGSWLVTRVRRRASARGVRAAGAGTAHHAQLAGVSARVRWQSWNQHEDQPSSPSIPPGMEQQIKDTLQRGLTCMSTDRNPTEVTAGHMSTDSFEMSSIERALPLIPETMQGSWRCEDNIEYLDGVHLILNPEGASLLPLAIDGRVLHGSHFTWREGGRAVTVLPPTVAGALATAEKPYATRGAWLQVVIPKELAIEMSTLVSSLGRLADTDSEPDSDDECERDSNTPALPLTLTWPEHRLRISVVYDQFV